jgi:hypothetical protein
MPVSKPGALKRNLAGGAPASASQGLQPAARRTTEIVSAAVLALVILATSAIRVRLLEAPLERDEGEYAYAGQLILRGSFPYQHVYNMKWPGTYYGYALLEAVFGDSLSGVRLGILVLNAATVMLVYLVARKLFDPPAAAAAGAAYAIMSIGPNSLAFFGHATHFVVFWALVGIVFIQRAALRPNARNYFLAGLGAGLAPIMKQPGLVFTAFIAICFFVQQYRSSASRRTRLIYGAALLSGVLLPFLAVLASVLANGSFDTFWVWTIEYPRYYGESISLAEVPSEFASTWYQATNGELLFWIIAALGLIALLWQCETRRTAYFLIGLLLLATAGVFPGRTFRPHYYILMLPAIALLDGSAAYMLVRWLRSWPVMLSRTCAAALVLIPAVVSIAAHDEFYFWRSPSEAVDRLYQILPFAECEEVGRYLREHTAPSDRVVVLGSEPQIYFYARRNAATGYVYTFSLMQPHPFARQFQEQMIGEIEQEQPLYFVHVRALFSWLPEPGFSPELWEWFNAYRDRNLKLVGVVEAGPNGFYCVWDKPDLRIDESCVMAIYRRATP